jgi:hypothetical protein
MVSTLVSTTYLDLVDEFMAESHLDSDDLIVHLVHSMIESDYDYAPEGLHVAVRDEQCRIFLLTCILQMMQRSLTRCRAELHTRVDEFKRYRLSLNSSEEVLAAKATDMADMTLDILTITSRIDIIAQIYRRVDTAVDTILHAPEITVNNYTTNGLDIDMVTTESGITVSRKALDAAERLGQRSTTVQDIAKGVVKFANRSDEQIVALLRWLRKTERDVGTRFRQPVNMLNNRLIKFEYHVELTLIQQSFDQIFDIDERVRSLVVLFRTLNDILPGADDDLDDEQLLAIATFLRQQR